MQYDGVGIVGTGIWQAPALDNEQLGFSGDERVVRDPFRGKLDEDGTLRLAGISLPAAKFPRTIEAARQAHLDPFRGARRRRRFPDDLTPSDAEADAARRALAAADIDPGQVGVLLVQSFLADRMQPMNAALVAHKLGIENVAAWNVDTACNSALTQLCMAAPLVHSGAAEYVLCVQSCPYSRVGDPDGSTAVQEGDLAAAFVVGRKPGARIAWSWRTLGEHHRAIALEWAHQTPTAAQRWRQDLRLRTIFERELQPFVIRELGEQIAIVADEALDRAGWDKTEVDLFVPFQSVAWIPEYLGESIGLPDGITFHTFAEYANSNAPGVTASLDEAIRAGRLKDGTRLLTAAGGAGYTFVAMAVEW